MKKRFITSGLRAWALAKLDRLPASELRMRVERTSQETVYVLAVSLF